MTYYYISWSDNKATFTRCFNSEIERNNFLKHITRRGLIIHTWTNHY